MQVLLLSPKSHAALVCLNYIDAAVMFASPLKQLPKTIYSSILEIKLALALILLDFLYLSLWLNKGKNINVLYENKVDLHFQIMSLHPSTILEDQELGSKVCTKAKKHSFLLSPARVWKREYSTIH